MLMMRTLVFVEMSSVLSTKSQTVTQHQITMTASRQFAFYTHMLCLYLDHLVFMFDATVAPLTQKISKSSKNILFSITFPAPGNSIFKIQRLPQVFHDCTKAAFKRRKKKYRN